MPETSLRRALTDSLAACHATRRTIDTSLAQIGHAISKCRTRWPAAGTHAELQRLAGEERGLNTDLDRIDGHIAEYAERLRELP